MIAHSEDELCEECKKFDLYVNHGGDPNEGFCNDILVVCTHPKKKSYHIVNVEQRSPAWHKFRQWKIGASMAPIIMNESPWETPGQLYQRIVEGIEIEVNADILRGVKLEPEALLLLNTRITADFKPCCFECLEYPWAIASTDGWDSKLEIGCELKAPRRFSKDQSTVPLKYKAQVQHCMMVCGCQQWIYAEYVDKELWHCVVQRDDEYIAKLIEAEKAFHENLMSFTKPKTEFDEEWSKLI